MSEENKQAVTETVSESPAKETTQDGSGEQYIAESKKYRNRAQVAETELAKLKSVNSKAEEQRLIAEGKKDELITRYQNDITDLTMFKDRWTSYEDKTRTSLLEKHPEDKRERLSKLNLEDLDYLTNEINKVNTANAPSTSQARATSGKAGDFGGYESAMEWVTKDPKGYEKAKNNAGGDKFGDIFTPRVNPFSENK